MDIANSIYSGSEGWTQLEEVIREYSKSGVYILVDENTKRFCLPVLRNKCEGLGESLVIEVHSSESNKTISTVEKIWLELVSAGATRKSLLICLGGGVVSDTGGFAAATFKRGMDFIHIPTTLLAMVDAALGGKTGVNLNSIKNQVGVFALPEAVFIFTEFLDTLPARQKLSGYAEMLKHAMIDSKIHFEQLLAAASPEKVFDEFHILESVAVKMKIINEDFTETGLRKALNFGHTIGHAIESYSQKYDTDPLLHGEAIAIGLLCESFISLRIFGMDENDLKKLASLISSLYPHYRINPATVDELLALMSHDKKNANSSELNFSLIRNLGEPVYDCFPDEKLIRESLHFYMNLPAGFYVS